MSFPVDSDSQLPREPGTSHWAVLGWIDRAAAHFMGLGLALEGKRRGYTDRGLLGFQFLSPLSFLIDWWQVTLLRRLTVGWLTPLLGFVSGYGLRTSIPHTVPIDLGEEERP